MWIYIIAILYSVIKVANAGYGSRTHIQSGSTLDKLGFSLSFNDDYLAVGSSGYNSNAGSARLYTYTQGSGFTSDFSTNIAFGSSRACGASVDANADHFILGCTGLDGQFAAFNKPFGSFVYDDVYTPATATTGSGFGQAVSLNGDRLVIGAPNNNQPTGDNRGSVYTYTWVTDHWEEDSRIDSPLAQDYYYFGYNLKQVGDTMVVTARDWPADIGGLYVYKWVSNAWTLFQELSPSSAYTTSFVMDIDFDGTTIVTGCPGCDGYYGGAFFWRWNGTAFDEYENNPVQHSSAGAAGGSNAAQYGDTVAVKGDVAVICAPSWMAPPDKFSAGRCYSHHFTGGVWGEDPELLTESTPTQNNKYGESDLVIHDDVVVVGFHRYGSNNNGKAEAWTYTAPTPAPTTASPTASPTVPLPTIMTSNVKFYVRNDTDRMTVIDDILLEFNNQFPDTTAYVIRETIKSEETGSISFQLVNDVNNNTLLAEKIAQVRCGSAADECNIVIENERRRLLSDDRRAPLGRELVDPFVIIEITFDLSSDLLGAVNGLDLSDPEFEAELLEALGLDNTTDITITSNGGDITVTATLESNESEDPLGENLVATGQEASTNLTDITNAILDALGGVDTQLLSTTVDLCPVERDCNGRGTCDPQTGVCACVGDWWGIDCETACECENDGECKNALCHCDYPYYGLRCNSTSTVCQTCEN